MQTLVIQLRFLGSNAPMLMICSLPYYTCFQKHRDPDFSLSTKIAFESPIVRVSFTLLPAPQIGCTLIQNVQMNIIAFRGSLYRMEDYLKGRSI